jgi:rhomboid family protein
VMTFWRNLNVTLDRFLTPAVKRILLINVGVWFVLITIDMFSGPTLDLVLRWIGQRPAYSHMYIWQFATYMFVHVGPMHLLGNMLVLCFFGPALEMRWGSRWFWKFYLATGIGAGIFHAAFNLIGVMLGPYDLSLLQATETLLSDPTTWIPGYPRILENYPKVLNAFPELTRNPAEFRQLLLALRHHDSLVSVIGASGSMYGVMLAFAAYRPNQMVLAMAVFPIKIKYLMAFLIFLETTFMATAHQSGISHFTHLSGLAIAYVMLAQRHHSWDIRRWQWLR